MFPHRIAILCTIVCLSLAVELPPRVSQPPTIIPEHPMYEVVFFDPEGIQSKEFPCKALGSEPKIFEWTKNGQPLKLDEPRYISNATLKPKIIRLDKNTGSIMLIDITEDDEGIYQCIAKNIYGTSLSKKMQLIKATKRSFNDPTSTKRYQILPANPLKIECNPPKNNPPGIVNWLQFSDDGAGKRTVDLNDRVSVDAEGNLYFANIQESDENGGEQYACEFQIREFNMYLIGAVSYIEVLSGGDPRTQYPTALIYTSDTNVVGLKGQVVKFQCIFTGNPTPTITWTRKDHKMDTSRSTIKFQKLIIKDIRYEDEGTYECKGENNVINQPQIHTFKLSVESKPEWTSMPQKVDAGVEESATFECAADGKPTPDVQWYINGQPIQNVPGNKRRILGNGQLRFMNLTRDDAQVIQCNTSNKHGYLWADVALSILAYKPEIRITFESIKVSEGSNAILPCDVDGKPTPMIYWKRNNQKMDGNRYMKLPTGNMALKSATKSDAGTWTCFAENKYGKINASVELLVREQTRIIKGPIPQVQMVKFGSKIQYTCDAYTDENERSNLIISWFKDGERVNYSNQRFSKHTGNGLIISGTMSADTGNYTCMATNGLDSANASAEVLVQAPPDSPKDVTVKTCKDQKALVSWNLGKDNFSPITHFHVEYYHTYNKQNDNWTLAAMVNNSMITELEVDLFPHANFTFRVIAQNELGKSHPSAQSSTVCATESKVPGRHPNNIHTDRSRTGWLIIKWDKMEEKDHNGKGFKYIVSIRRDSKTNKTEISDWNVNVKEFDFGNLIYEPFDIYVEAKNDIGVCPLPADMHIGYTGEAEPLSVPQNFELQPDKNVTATSAWFQWDHVSTSPENIRGEFRGYKIRFWKVGERERTMKTVMIARLAPKDMRIKRANKESAEVIHLPSYSDIEAEVVTMNTFFESNASNVINFTTPEGVPGPVKFAQIFRRGVHHFLLDWTEPKEHNGVLRGYNISYTKVDGFNSEDTQVIECGPNKTRAIIDNLHENSNYMLCIAAHTKAGLGAKYCFDGKTANPGELLVPIIKIGMVDEDSVNVTWSVLSDKDMPAGSHHYVRYRKSGQAEWMKTENEIINSWMNISGLAPNTHYEISVVASNGKVEMASEMQRITTRTLLGASQEKSIAQATWFIAMMVAIAVLILFLIIVCFIKRSRGEKYNVQEREKLRGADLENGDKDLFNEYPKSGDPLAVGSPDSFDNDTGKLPGGSESDSMAEYGDVDPSKFNEDGSFIDQYGTPKQDEKGNQSSTMSTFV